MDPLEHVARFPCFDGTGVLVDGTLVLFTKPTVDRMELELKQCELRVLFERQNPPRALGRGPVVLTAKGEGSAQISPAVDRTLDGR